LIITKVSLVSEFQIHKPIKYRYLF